MTIYAKELQRRLDSDEPIDAIAKWYLHLEEPWQMYFSELEPIEQEFVKQLCEEFRAQLEKILPSGPGSFDPRH
jgi:hypothetical protein